MNREPDALLAAAAAGSRVALARLISYVESGGARQREVVALAWQHEPAYVVGITGPPGAGKSTLTDRMITSGLDVGDAGRELSEIAVLAVDPSSPFTGGAILGDRIRMQEHATNERVFIRSMATRGHLGGLSLAVPDALRVLGASGFSTVLVETVGVGQMEVEIASAADTTVVVTTPGLGDAMQANKAGLLEVADVFVINKADRPGLRETRRDLEQMLDLGAVRDWRPPIVETVAASGTGDEALWEAINAHREFLGTEGLVARRERRIRVELAKVLAVAAQLRVNALAGGTTYEELIGELVAGRTDPYRAADVLLSLT